MKEKVNSFKDLKVWQKAYSLTLEIYKITTEFPKHEQYGLSSQMRRACVSIVSNIAEGYTRKGRSEYLNFLSISYASLAELETQLLLTSDLKYMPKEKLQTAFHLKEEIGAMLYTMQQKLRVKRY